MVSVKWTEAAREDVVEIRDHISIDSVDRAIGMVDRIKAAIESCRMFPRASTRVLEWDREDLRETYVGPYRVIYQFTQNTIFVIGVIHSARHLPRADRVLGRDQQMEEHD